MPEGRDPARLAHPTVIGRTGWVENGPGRAVYYRMHPLMEIDLEDIPDEGLELDLHGEAVTLGLAVSEIGVEGPVALTARLDRAGTTVNASGRLSARVRLLCSRCAREIPVDLQSEFQTVFAPLAESPTEPEVQLARADLDVIFYTGAVIPVHQLIGEQILLTTPMRPLCSADCKGLCPRCGHDRNVVSCACPPEASGRRLLDRIERKDRLDRPRGT